MTLPRRPALLATTLTVAVLAGVAWAAEAQSPQPPVAAAPPVVAQAGKPSVSTKEAIRPAQVRTAPAPRAEAKPTWVELTLQQQASLAPLSATWPTLGEAHKRKWLALSENFHAMPAPEQARLHSRMTEWAALSPQQRNAARLNFAEAQKVAPEDKRAKWEAYQALPPEEKKRLAARAAATKPPPPPTAMAVQPVPKEKLAKIPPKTRTKGVAPKGEAPPALIIVPGPAENSALLPTPASPVAP
jgi:hypothetical protein